MAIDTEAKRFRIMDMDTPAGAPGIPTAPGGTLDGGERAAFLWLYFAGAVTVLGLDVVLTGTIFEQFILAERV